MAFTKAPPADYSVLRKFLRPINTGRFDFTRKPTPFEPPKDERPLLSFREFVTKYHPKFKWYKHCIVIADVLQKVADGELPRVIIMAPPRHGKSEEVSRLFPAYLLYRFPENFVAVTSYGASLARRLSRAARDFALAAGVVLRRDSRAVNEFNTTQGGGLWSAGRGGAATGKGYHVGIGDDWIKDAKEAASDTIGEGLMEWYDSTFYTRGEPGAAIVITITRWPGPGDFVGKLFERELQDDQPERWHVVALEAIKTDEVYEIPHTCTLEPDWREPGEALCPERYPLDRLKRIAARIGSFFWTSLFRQRKSQREGSMFKRSWWHLVDEAPVCQRYVRYWDLAGTEPKKSKKNHDPDYTASTLMGKMADNRRAIIDVTEFRESIGQRNAHIEAIAKDDYARFGLNVQWWFEQEAGVGGEERTDAVLRLVQNVGIAAFKEPATGDKILRAEPFASAAEANNVLVAPFIEREKGIERERFLTHMADFSRNCAHDDIADSGSGAYNKLAMDTGGDYGTSSWDFGSDDE